MVKHEDLTSVHLFAYVSASDPGAVGAGKGWVDTSGSPAVLKVRNAGDSGWDALGAAPSSHTHPESEITGLVTDLAGKQPLDGDLTAIAALTPTNDDLMQRKAGAWTNRTPTQLLADLAALPAFPLMQKATVNFVIDGGALAITTGIKGDMVVPFTGTIVAATLLADQTGSIVLDLWKDTYANFPPVVGDSITAAAKPTLSGAAKSQNTTLTGWTTAVTAGDIIRVNVDSVATVTRVTLALDIVRTA